MVALRQQSWKAKKACCTAVCTTGLGLELPATGIQFHQGCHRQMGTWGLPLFTGWSQTTLAVVHNVLNKWEIPARKEFQIQLFHNKLTWETCFLQEESRLRYYFLSLPKQFTVTLNQFLFLSLSQIHTLYLMLFNPSQLPQKYLFVFGQRLSCRIQHSWKYWAPSLFLKLLISHWQS